MQKKSKLFQASTFLFAIMMMAFAGYGCDSSGGNGGGCNWNNNTDTQTDTSTGTSEDTDTSTTTTTSSDTDTSTATNTSSDTDTSTSTNVSTDGLFRINSSGNITENGSEIPVHCGAWFGLEGRHEPSDDATNPSGAPMELYVGNVFWQPSGRTIQQTMDEITERGFNIVRLPIAPQTLDPDDPQGQPSVFKNDSSVQSENSRAQLEEFITLADQNDIKVIIDIHSCSNYVGWRAGRLDATPPYADADRDNYDFKREDYACADAGDGVTVHEYNESLWLEDLKEIAGLAEDLGVDNILAIDIFNEPWDYTWAEWKEMAEKAYEAIDSVNQDVLIMVEGIGSELSDGTAIPNGDADLNPNWGENFYQAGDDPLDIPKERLILSPHTYGPSVFVQRQFLDPDQTECAGLEGEAAGDAQCDLVIDPDLLETGWEEHFGYLKDQGYAIVIGEFGGNPDWPEGAAIRDQDRWGYLESGYDREWQNAFVDYMNKKGIEGCYWSINPESGDTGGLYNHAYDPISNTSGWGTWLEINSEKMSLLDELWAN